MQQKERSPFPKNLVPITDEERIQNIPGTLTKYLGKEFVVSYKLDGSSITIIHQKVLWKSKYRICSRRFELHDKNNDWVRVFKSTNFDLHIQKLVKFFNTNDIIVQGEAIGRFNGNHHNLREDEIRAFSIYVKGERIPQKKLIDVCRANNIPYCPLYKNIVLNHSMSEILNMSELKDALNPLAEAEGLVWRCVDDNFSFKVVNNNYLIRHES